MKRKAQHFPQISRIIPATLYIIVLKAVVLVAVAAFLALNLFWQLSTEPTRIRQAKLAVMLSPNDLSNHLLLTQKYLDQGNMKAVERELILAQNLSTRPASSFPLPTSSVLGVTLSPLKILEKIKNEPQKIKDEIVFWEKIVADKPNYRDGYLRLALLNYQIYENQKARVYLERAKTLDPNFETTKELEKILK